MVALATLHDWSPAPGSHVSWRASSGARAKARQAPISNVPASYQQAQHLRGLAAHAAENRDMARLLTGAWDIAGTCDIPVMTSAITAHLRRHDAYHSWFEYKNGQEIVRRTIRDPADIDVVATEHGDITSTQLRTNILATPDAREWDCFSFGIIQRADHFTFYMSLDHLLTDGMSTGVIFLEIHMMYAALIHGAGPLPLPDRASYDDYCLRQRQHAAALTPESPEVLRWIEFAERNDGAEIGDGGFLLASIAVQGEQRVGCFLRRAPGPTAARFEQATGKTFGQGMFRVYAQKRGQHYCVGARG